MPDSGTESHKQVLHRYLRNHRQAVLWKLDGLSERAARTPMTPTGTNVLGLVKHLAYVEAGYLGDTFDRPVPGVPRWDELDYDADPQLDMYAAATESLAEIRDLFVRVGEHTDETIEALSVDSPGLVPWWRPGTQEVTLQLVLVHLLTEFARHAGHLDIVREQLDGFAGLRAESPNLPGEDEVDWATYVEKLRGIAEGF